MLKQTSWEAIVAVPWPALAPITTFYYVQRTQETQELERWANRAVDFVKGVTPGLPVIVNAAAYAAHVGHAGRAIAGLSIARESGYLVEAAVPDTWHVGLSPVYHLPTTVYRLD